LRCCGWLCGGACQRDHPFRVVDAVHYTALVDAVHYNLVTCLTRRQAIGQSAEDLARAALFERPW
jgi:hypothetical protein